MALQIQFENAKYRQWAKAGLGLGYLKEGLAPFCQDVAKQQHKDILDNIQHTKALPVPVMCGACQLGTLKPDHVYTGNKVCPNGQVNCNCLFPNGKNPCPNNICGAIYDGIIQSHASTPLAPNWKNTDAQMWTADPWSIAKCFINAPGYDQRTSAADTDCTGLLHVIINNKYFRNHISCNLTGASIFLKVRKYRNEIFHSSSMELEETEANSYIDDMISILQDGKELKNKPYAKDALKKLQALKAKDFIITTQGMEEVLKQIKEEMEKVLKSTENLATKDEYENLKTKLADGKDKTVEEHLNLKKKLTELETLMSQEKEGKLEAEKEHAELKKKLTELETLMSKEKAGKFEAEKEYLELKQNFNKLEALVSEQKVEIETMKKGKAQQKQTDYEQAKSEWRNKMIRGYLENDLKVSAMPLQPDKECDFSKVYVRPKIVSEVKDEKGRTTEIEIKSMSEIFTRNDVPLKLVYVVGDAGTGKTSFCKYLVHCWCMAHSEGQIVEDDFNSINEMKRFDFLFLISLRHNQNMDSIHEMLKNQYDIDILGTLLEKESSKMIILLDGLDEWSSEGKTYSQTQTMGLPKHGSYKNYTIVTTTRPWKIHTLRVNDKEIQQMLKLKGIDAESENEMINRTVSNITSKKDGSKDVDDCWRKLQEESLSNLKQVPIMLQQLICLWFDGHLDKTSRCDVFTEMLELFFTWNEDKTVGTNLRKNEVSQNMELPECFKDKEMCELNSHLIHDMAQLAFETLFNCPKEKSLTFDISVFKTLEISDEMRERCLKLGILTNDRCPSLSVSKRPKPMFSFIHKSVQEFLAAVNIAINFITKMNSLNNLEYTDLQYIKKVFINCSTVNEILNQSNVIIMLCGLEHRLATYVSKYIYDIVEEDPLVKRYRRTIDSDSIVSVIQTLIFDLMKECNTCLVESKPTFYIGDLYISDYGTNEYCDIACSNFDPQQITPDFIHSIFVGNIYTITVKFSKYLSKFKHLEKINIYNDPLNSSSSENIKHKRIDVVNNSVVETIEINVSSLKSLSLCDRYEKDTESLTRLDNYSSKFNSLCKKVVRVLPSMTNLVAINMTGETMTMSHEDTTSFCRFLEGTSLLEEIHILFYCECRGPHYVDLSKLHQLKCLISNSYICVKDIDTVNLETFKGTIREEFYVKIIDCIGKCDKLEELRLDFYDLYYETSLSTSTTEKLTSVLPLLHNLRKLSLFLFWLNDNIIQFPSEMKSLIHIDLCSVTMSLTTWKKFVDSLLCIPHGVNMCIGSLCIAGDGEEFICHMLSRLGEKKYIHGLRLSSQSEANLFNCDTPSLLERTRERKNEAMQYVKDKRIHIITSEDLTVKDKCFHNLSLIVLQ